MENNKESNKNYGQVEHRNIFDNVYQNSLQRFFRNNTLGEEPVHAQTNVFKEGKPVAQAGR